MRIVRGSEEARRTILRRQGWGTEEAPPSIWERTQQAVPGVRTLQEFVQRVIDEVRTAGDAAVHRYNEVFDGFSGLPLEVQPGEIEAAYSQVRPDVVAALQVARDRVRSFHEAQLQHGPTAFIESGLGMVVRPLERVGLYVPGTAAVYPSSVLHTVLPARVAGVREVVIASPAGPDGQIAPVKLVAAHIAGADRVFRMSGAHAIAALAFGTESVPRVDKVCGPGNIFVTIAKRLVYGVTGIDALYGPTETVVLADESADPVLCAADLLAQAEHDEMASPVLITTSMQLALKVSREVDAQLASMERGPIARAAVERQGGAVIVDSIEEGIALANEFAPEHLCLLTRDPESLVPFIKNAGGIFCGESSPEAFGDYVAGPSHVMPTGGTARFASPLSVLDFLKMTSVVAVDRSALEAWGPAGAAIARSEGLTGHARSLELRLEGR
jgi:histidinol dehydrogenase